MLVHFEDKAKFGDITPFFTGPYIVTKLKGFYPAEPNHVVNGRRRTLVQVHTDTGMRTLAVADIWGRDPTKYNKPW